MFDFCFLNAKKYNVLFHSITALMIIFFWGMMPSRLYAEDSCLSPEFKTFTFYMENDIFAEKDGQYTNGFKLTWTRYGLEQLPEDAWAHRWLYPVVKRLGFAKKSGSEKALTFSVGQNIYTPDDIEETERIPDDRPYAGILYMELGFHRRFRNRMHTLGLYAGIVGPHSYAEALQSEGHALFHNKEPKGWDHQLEDEPVLCLIYDYKRKMFASNINAGAGGDIIFNTGAGLGNVKTFCHAGLMMRYGWNVPNDFGNFPIQPATCFHSELKESVCGRHKKKYGAHLFFSAGCQLVLHDILLDGNTFRDSHNVDKKPVIGIFMGGIGLVTGRVKTVIAYVARTKSFDTQSETEAYGSMNVSFHY
jgi:hypothetical protein